MSLQERKLENVGIDPVEAHEISKARLGGSAFRLVLGGTD